MTFPTSSSPAISVRPSSTSSRSKVLWSAAWLRPRPCAAGAGLARRSISSGRIAIRHFSPRCSRWPCDQRPWPQRQSPWPTQWCAHISPGCFPTVDVWTLHIVKVGPATAAHRKERSTLGPAIHSQQYRRCQTRSVSTNKRTCRRHTDTAVSGTPNSSTTEPPICVPSPLPLFIVMAQYVRFSHLNHAGERRM